MHAVKFGTFLMTTIIPTTMTVIAITPTSATTPPKNSCFIHICIRCAFGITERKKCELDTCPCRVNPSTVIEKLHVYKQMLMLLL